MHMFYASVKFIDQKTNEQLDSILITKPTRGLEVVPSLGSKVKVRSVLYVVRDIVFDLDLSEAQIFIIEESKNA